MYSSSSPEPEAQSIIEPEDDTLPDGRAAESYAPSEVAESYAPSEVAVPYAPSEVAESYAPSEGAVSAPPSPSISRQSPSIRPMTLYEVESPISPLHYPTESLVASPSHIHMVASPSHIHMESPIEESDKNGLLKFTKKKKKGALRW